MIKFSEKPSALVIQSIFFIDLVSELTKNAK